MPICKLHLLISVSAFLGMMSLSGCAGLAKGVTQGFLKDDEDENEDIGQCYIRGPVFEGVAALADQPVPQAEAKGKHERVLKLLMVHGVGKHFPGYSTRLAENLSRALDLNVVDADIKQITLREPQRFPGQDLGTLRVSRFSDKSGTRAMVFYELTWSGITEKERQTIAYDDSAYSFGRAAMNDTMKGFVNSNIADPLVYLGDAQKKIQQAVSQAFCWSVGHDWNEIEKRTDDFCDLSTLTADQVRDGYAFITHSLGSRIVTDFLDRLAGLVPEGQKDRRYQYPNVIAALRDKELSVFMLANQLPLLQLGRPEPQVKGQKPQYCGESAPKHEERALKRLRIVAFSDPNDILSWAVPPDFIDEYIDSRACPQLTSVFVNVTPVTGAFGLKFANPREAHIGYQNDPRVIGLMAGGVGTGRTDVDVQSSCQWLESR